jgi:hypothetical protein
MPLFDLFKSRFPMAPMNRVSSVEIEPNGFACSWNSRPSIHVDWDAIHRVIVRTTNAGPFDEDVFVVIESSVGTFIIPQSAAGTDNLLSRLQALPGFDNETFIQSMSSAENNDFVCWVGETT